jgi:hypothetical protein
MEQLNKIDADFTKKNAQEKSKRVKLLISEILNPKNDYQQCINV